MPHPDAVSPGHSHVLVAHDHGRLRLQVVDEHDVPLSYLAYTVQIAGRRRVGFLDRDGWLTEERLPEGEAEVIIHGLDAEEWTVGELADRGPLQTGQE